MRYRLRKVNTILREIKKYNNKNRGHGVSIRDLESLINNGGKIIELNKEAGNCYCHLVQYGGKEFFTPTGKEVSFQRGRLYVKKN